MGLIKWSQVPILYNVGPTTKICVIDGADPDDMLISVDNLFSGYLTSLRLDSWDDYIVGVSEKLVLSAYLGYNLKLRLDALNLENIAYKNQDNVFIANNTFSGEVYTKYIDLNSTLANPTYKEGRFFYDNITKSLSIFNDLSGEYHTLGREFLKRVTNNSGAPILKGKVVYLNNNISGLPTIELARADLYNTSRILGIVTSDILNGSLGDITILGDLNNLNLSTLSNGPVYLSPIMAGELTSTKPTNENYIVTVGLVEKISGNNTLYIFPSSSEYTAESVNITGFPSYVQNLDRIIAFDDTSKTFSIRPTVGKTLYHYYQNGIKYNSSITNSLIISNVTGLHLIYYDELILKELVNPSFDDVLATYINYVPISVINWDATFGQCNLMSNDMHLFRWPNTVLANNHTTIGGVYGLGLDISVVDNQFGISEGKILTEDVITSVPNILYTAGLPIFYRLNASTWNTEVNTGYSFILNTPLTKTLFNKDTAGTWSLQDMQDNYYSFIHVFAQNNLLSDKVIAFMGTNEYELISTAEFGLEAEILELNVARKSYLISEKHLYSIIIQNKITLGVLETTIVPNSTGTYYYDFRNNKNLFGSGVRTILALTDTPDVYSTPTKPVKVTSTGLIWENIFESNITLEDNTTNNADVNKHGFLPKLANDITKYLRSDGTWTILPSQFTSIGTTDGKLLGIDSNGFLTSKPLISDYIVSYNESKTFINPYSLVTKEYVDVIASIGVPKLPVDAATTENIDLNGEEIIDDFAAIVGTRILVKNQTDPSENGVYDVTAGAWIRATDSDTWTELYREYVIVLHGTNNIGRSYVCTVPEIGTLESDPIYFEVFNIPSNITGGNGLTKVGNALNVNVDGVTIELNSNNLRVLPNIFAPYTHTHPHNHDGIYEFYLDVPSADNYVLSSTIAGVRSWVPMANNGALMGSLSQGFTNATVVTVNHNLGVNPLVEVIGTSGETIIPYSIVRTTLNQVVVTFTIAKSGTILLSYGSGIMGIGVPSGGTANQVLAKIDSTDYNLHWVTTSITGALVDGDFISNGIMVRTAEGVYGIITDNSTNWNTAYSNSHSHSNIVALDLVSGTNTGDETITTIKSKLGITTLSGSNTGDQTLSDLGGVVANANITAATNTKITYDTKGLVTSGTSATTADIAASTNKNYVTDTQLTVLGNTSGVNSGDNAINSLYSSLVSNVTHTGDVIGSSYLTIANNVVDYSKSGSEFKDLITISNSSLNIDWSLGAGAELLMTADRTFTFANLRRFKTLSLILTGAFTPTVPGTCINGGTYDGTKTNYYFFTCLNTVTPVIVYSLLKI